jgi:hypothetical protein
MFMPEFFDLKIKGIVPGDYLRILFLKMKFVCKYKWLSAFSGCISNCRWLVGTPATETAVVGVLTDHSYEGIATT